MVRKVPGPWASLVVAALCAPPGAHPQSANLMFGLGYLRPVPSVARGQIVNLFVQGVGSKLTGRVTAPGLPLPTSLAGISVTVGGLQAPILAVQPLLTCVVQPITGCGSYAVISAQVPFEIPPAGDLSQYARFTVQENGAAGGQFEASLQPDQVHIATTCDLDITFAAILCNPAPMITTPTVPW